MVAVCVQPANALDDAVYFLRSLQQLAVNRVETHVLAYRIYMRKGNVSTLFDIVPYCMKKTLHSLTTIAWDGSSSRIWRFELARVKPN